MELVLIRHTLTPWATMGSLYIAAEFQCFTLEDPDRLAVGLPKIAGETAIPAGRYRVVTTWSPKFKRPLPLLLEVPDFSGVRIHPGNIPRDTAGCILPGYVLKRDALVPGSSLPAFRDLAKRIVEGEKAGEVWLLLVDQLDADMVERLRAEWA